MKKAFTFFIFISFFIFREERMHVSGGGQGGKGGEREKEREFSGRT